MKLKRKRFLIGFVERVQRAAANRVLKDKTILVV